MAVAEAIKENSRPYIEQMMKKFVKNRNCLGLLRFFASHPNGRFSKLAIIHAVDDECNKLEMNKALDDMAGERILDVSSDKNTHFYMLTKEEVLRRLVLNAAIFEWRDWQLLLEHT